jgi:flagellar motor switch protein FliM
MSQPQPYNFAEPGRLTADVEQRVSGWLRAAAALAAKKAARQLPFTPEMSLVGVEVQRPAEGLAKLPEAAAGYGLSLGGEAANAMLALPRPLALAVVGAMLGDVGPSLPEDRDLTVVEVDLFEFFTGDVLVGTLQETWPAAEAVPLVVRGREVHPRWTRIFPPDDNVVVCTFALKGPFGDSEWYLLLSQKQLLGQVALAMPGGDRPKGGGGPPESVRLRLLVEELPVELTVLLGTVELSLADLARLSVGDVVILNQRVSETLPAVLAGEKMCKGWPGRVGSRQAFEIESFLGG